MNGVSKVLTVSYGSFSCSLEGFEDPFKTMTAITEYFQKLASDDRQFGAVSLQADLETLRGLASQTGKKVQAEQVAQDHFYLRATQAEAAKASPAPALAVEDIRGTMPSGVGLKLARLRDAVLGFATSQRAQVEPVLPKAAAQSDLTPLKEESAPYAAEKQLQGPAPVAEQTVEAAEQNPDALAVAPAEAALAQSVERARARVIRIRRRDIEPSQEALPPPPEAEASSPLAEELSLTAEPRSILAAHGPEDVDRLMDQAAHQMKSPAMQRRIASILHLRAAVAASVAEQSNAQALTLTPSQAQPTAFGPMASGGDGLARATLVLENPVTAQPVSQSVSDQPDAAQQRETEVDPSPMRPAPLVLVPNQRVDKPEPKQEFFADPIEQAQPALIDDFDLSLQAALADEITPPAAEKPVPSQKGLEDYAKALTPLDNVDRLSLAAAYLRLTKGQAQFDRGELMDLAKSLSPAEVSREDLLRGFGTALRQGQLRKAARGRYEITDEAEMLQRARKIA